jgi:hypothetical protein
MKQLKFVGLQLKVLIAAVVINFGSIGALAYANQAPAASGPVTISAPPVLPPAAISGRPVSLSVQSLGLRLNVETGEYNQASDSWTLSGLNAHFATVTSLANNSAGNTFIYGHNNNDVFGPLKRLQPNAEVEITTDNGSIFYYSLVNSKTVAPSDVSIFNYSGPPILTIQTCTGAFHEQRELYQFKFERVVESQASIDIRTEANRKAMIQLISATLTPDISLQPQQIAQGASPTQSVDQPRAPTVQPQDGIGEQLGNQLASLLEPDQPTMWQLDSPAVQHVLAL